MMELRKQVTSLKAEAKSNWNAILSFAAVAITTQLLWVTFTPFTTQAAQALGVSDNSIGWLSEVFPLVYVILAIPFGLITDRWFRSSVAFGTILTVIGALLRLNGHFTMILVGQLITSIGQPLILSAINKVALVYATPRRQAVTIGLCSSSLFLGILIAMLSGPLLLSAYDLHSVLLIQAVFAVATSVWLLAALYLPDRHASSRAGITPPNKVSAQNTGPSQNSVSLRAIWSNRQIRVLCYLLFVGFGLFIALTTWLQALLAPKHISDVEVGIALALMTAAGMVGAATVPDWAIRRSRGRRMIISSLIASFATCLYILVGVPFWVMVMLLMVTGFLLLADLPIVLTTAELLTDPSQAGTVTALLMLFGNAGGIILAILVQGLIFSIVAAVAVLVMAAVIAIPLALQFPEYHSRTGTS